MPIVFLTFGTFEKQNQTKSKNHTAPSTPIKRPFLIILSREEVIIWLVYFWLLLVETVLGDDLVIPDVDFATQQHASVSETGSIDAESSNKGDETDTELEVEDAGSVTQRNAESEYHLASSDAGCVMQRCSSDSESNPMDVGSVMERDLSDIEPDPVDVRSWMESSFSNTLESADTSDVDDSPSEYVLRGTVSFCSFPYPLFRVNW